MLINQQVRRIDELEREVDTLRESLDRLRSAAAGGRGVADAFADIDGAAAGIAPDDARAVAEAYRAVRVVSSRETKASEDAEEPEA